MSHSTTLAAHAKLSDDRAINLGMGGLVLSIAICVVVSITSFAYMLQYLYPILSVGIGMWFLVFVPQYYASFSLWLWFVTPLIRRLVDYQSGHFNEDPIIMIAPYVVSGLAFFSILRHWRTLRHPAFFPLIVALVATTYGLLITFGLGSPVAAVTEYLGWSGPILLAMVIMIHWEKYPNYKSAIGKTFTYALLALGIYALIQYFIFPPWDEMWFLGSGMNSIGRPEALQVRVWSMLNAPGPFAVVVFSALMLQFVQKGLVSRAAIFVGAIGLILSNVRSAMGALVIAMLVAFVRSDGKLKRRLLITLTLSIVVGVPLFLRSGLSEPITERFNERMETLENVEDDGSFKARLELHTKAPALIMSNPLGAGYDSRGYDSGWIAIFVHLGLFAGAAYLFALLRLVWITVKLRLSDTDHFAMLTLSVGVGMLALMMGGSQHYGVHGMILWTMFALTQAAAFCSAAEAPA